MCAWTLKESQIWAVYIRRLKSEGSALVIPNVTVAGAGIFLLVNCLKITYLSVFVFPQNH